MLKEYCAGSLQWVDSNACAGNDGGCRRVDLKLFRYEFNASDEWGLLWNGNAKSVVMRKSCGTYVLKGSLGSEALVILKETFCMIFFCCYCSCVSELVDSSVFNYSINYIL